MMNTIRRKIKMFLIRLKKSPKIEALCFRVTDGMFPYYEEVRFTIKETFIVAEKFIEENYIKKYNRYQIKRKLWENFIRELICEHHFLNWDQTRFATYIFEEVYDDVSYNLDIVFNNKFSINYYGGTSSEGVQLIKYLLKKHFDLE